jgi:hypothetical protein
VCTTEMARHGPARGGVHRRDVTTTCPGSTRTNVPPTGPSPLAWPDLLSGRVCSGDRRSRSVEQLSDVEVSPAMLPAPRGRRIRAIGDVHELVDLLARVGSRPRLPREPRRATRLRAGEWHLGSLGVPRRVRPVGGGWTPGHPRGGARSDRRDPRSASPTRSPTTWTESSVGSRRGQRRGRPRGLASRAKE